MSQLGRVQAGGRVHETVGGAFFPAVCLRCGVFLSTSSGGALPAASV